MNMLSTPPIILFYCSQDPSLFGYSNYTTRDTFKITVDFISALSAISANYGIVKVKDMVFLSRYESVTYNGVEITINAMYYEGIAFYFSSHYQFGY